MFVMYGGSMKGHTKSEYVQFPHSILVKVDDSDRAVSLYVICRDAVALFAGVVIGGPFGVAGL